MALVDAEPTQPVDRLERALAQEIAGLGAGDDVQSAARGNGTIDTEMSEDPGTWPGSIGTTGTGGPVVSIPGRGGFPHKVTSPGRDQRVQFAAVWATLPAPPQADSAVAGIALGALARSELPVAQAVAYSSVPESPDFPDYVKAACGLALGLGLTTGPLFPDLIASLPGRLPKWLSVLRSRRGRRVVASETKKRIGRSRMPTWLRALLESRVEESRQAPDPTGPNKPERSMNPRGCAIPYFQRPVNVACGAYRQSAPTAEVMVGMAQALEIRRHNS